MTEKTMITFMEDATDELKKLLTRHPILYTEHRNGTFSCGRFFILGDNGEVRNITFQIARCLEIYDSHNIVRVLNHKTGESVKCIKTIHPDSLIRDLSEKLYDRWDVINFYILENERMF